MIYDSHARPRSLSKYCEFADVDTNRSNRTSSSNLVRRHAFDVGQVKIVGARYDLETGIIDVGRFNEAAERQVKAIEGGRGSIVAAVQRDSRQRRQSHRDGRRGKPCTTDQLCRFRGRQYA